ncbi:peptide deformylase [Candidatus Pacearchaeota archaeon]|nr:peptide deformylase [Candidatus Pacearchaeota archaeon]
MIKSIITDKKELAKVCTIIGWDTSSISQDLLDTANSLYKECAGLAANQIGYSARVITVKFAGGFEVMVDPIYIEKSGKIKWGKEGCLSHPETIKNPVNVKRHYKIKIKYRNVKGDVKTKTFRNFFARVVQHEMDHLEGILI